MRTNSLNQHTSVTRFVWLALVAAVCIGVPRVASANAAPPMPRTWFTFFDAANRPVHPSGVQILDCEAAESKCAADAALLANFGNCEAAPCLKQAQPVDVNFGCADNACLLMLFNGIPARFKLVVQANNQRYTSDVIPMPEQRGYTARHFKVNLTNDGRATPTVDLDIPGLAPRSDFGLAFLLTLVSEVIVIALFLRWLKQPVWPLLGFAALMQVLSFPVVWYFFPSFLQWHLGSERLVGAVVLASALGLGGLLIWVRLAPTRNSRILSIVLLVLAALVSVVCMFGTLLVAGYGNNEFPQTSGVSYPVMLVLAELFAVAFEAVLLHFLSRRSLSLRQTALISLAANLASFVLGLLLFPIAPQLM